MTILCPPKVAHHHDRLAYVLAQCKRVLSPHSECRLAWSYIAASGRSVGSAYCNWNALRAFGADNEKPNRTPSAWMISLPKSLALRQRLFFGWATLNEQNWSTLGERRGLYE
jgi:hypothetical protein